MAFEKLYTAEDVAQITGLTLRTIRNYIKSGRLKGHRVGVQWRFTEADIQALFAGSSPTSDTALTNSTPAPAAPVMDAAAIAAISAAASAMVNAGVAAGMPGGAGAAGLMPAGVGAAAQAEMTATAEEELTPNDDQIRRFVQRKNPPRTSACCVVDKLSMTEQEARFLFNRLQTLASVYADTPKRLEVTYEYDEDRNQARFVFSGALEAACAMMNLCDVQ
ncbi:MAG: helix-turn-helix domain-containing protein [Lachnospiraceae bacterium]|nr:helix-turn-helix domain-containing protein [Lachnospiraceae bacterium]